MTTPSPATKAGEIQEKLISFWNARQMLSELEFRILERQAKSIPDYVEKHDTLGMMYAIQKKDDLMQVHYETALSSVLNLGVLCNYLSALTKRCLFKKLREVVDIYKEDLTDIRSLKQLLEVSSLFLDYELADLACKRISSIGETPFFVATFRMRVIQISEILNMTNCTERQIDMLVDVCSTILRKYDVSSSSIQLECIAGGHYVFGVDTDNIDTIVDMNFELADRVVLIPELDDCKLIAMFRPAKTGVI